MKYVKMDDGDLLKSELTRLDKKYYSTDQGGRNQSPAIVGENKLFRLEVTIVHLLNCFEKFENKKGRKTRV